jgi:multidrug transporter EmrE-like cation transporter
MNVTNFICLSSFATLLAVGQLLFKRVGLSIGGMPVADGLFAMARTPSFYGALSLYGVSTLLWIWILSRIPLSQAYPWVAVTMAIVPLLGRFVFSERLSNTYWLGIGLVMLGVFLTQYATLAAAR